MGHKTFAIHAESVDISIEPDVPELDGVGVQRLFGIFTEGTLHGMEKMNTELQEEIQSL